MTVLNGLGIKMNAQSSIIKNYIYFILTYCLFLFNIFLSPNAEIDYICKMFPSFQTWLAIPYLIGKCQLDYIHVNHVVPLARAKAVFLLILWIIG